jgi:hypothetical protein
MSCSYLINVYNGIILIMMIMVLKPMVTSGSPILRTPEMMINQCYMIDNYKKLPYVATNA